MSSFAQASAKLGARREMGVTSVVPLGVREPTPLQRWAASRWDKPKDARPSVEEVKGLLRGIRKSLVDAG